MTIAAGTQFAHYEIIARLGAGGMGEVYLAKDARLDRQVALKLLPAEFTQDADRVRRFMQEAKAASALNHPNIITVYDIGESEAGRFIVMELVAGRTLRAVTAEDNSLETLLTLGQQMAKALSAAHAAGITHRDIKPDNIMVRDDGYVKVLDFGLARLLPATASGEDAATLAQQTTPGQLMGTVAYMSPEQASGQSVSHPSDIFALGIVLYELATGRHPFQADTLVGYLHAITLQTPAPLTSLQPELPAALNDLILRMLAKEANQRPTASEVARQLQAIERNGNAVRPQHVESETMILPSPSGGTTHADEGFWVAVLPFKWRGANADLEALAEGLSEDIVTGLSRFSYLRVIARGSTLRFTSAVSDVRTIGKELGARYVMEGNLRQAGSVLRVAVQLVDASTGAHLWAGRCSERLAGTEAYLPLLEALESLLRDGTASGSEPGSLAATMRQLAPTWYAQVAPLSGDSEESARLLAEVKAASQERMKRELASFLQAVAEPRPLVLFFDDLHWADVSTIDLLNFLAGKFEGMNVLILVTYRPSDMLLSKHPFLQIKPDLQARGLCRELLLEFLTEAEIAEYLALEFPGHRFPAEFPQLIHAKTEGSPLFMADLVRYLRDRNVIANTSGAGLHLRRGVAPAAGRVVIAQGRNGGRSGKLLSPSH
ncbi:MAG: protein kinase domain-containing protein [Blastocatellia bacterium]